MKAIRVYDSFLSFIDIHNCELRNIHSSYGYFCLSWKVSTQAKCPKCLNWEKESWYASIIYTLKPTSPSKNPDKR